MKIFKVLLSILTVLEVSIQVLTLHNSLWNKRDLPHKVGGTKQTQKTQAPEIAGFPGQEQ